MKRKVLRMDGREALDGLVLVNNNRRAMRITGALGCVCIVIAGASLALLTFGVKLETGAGQACLLSLILSGVGAFALFLVALITMVTARATDRVFDQFRRGEALADWHFPPDEWEAFLHWRQMLEGKNGWIVPAAVVAPSVIVGGFVIWGLTPGMMERGRNLALMAAAAAAIWYGIRWLMAAVTRAIIAKLRRNPRVLIGPSAVYSGGTLAFWGASMLVLQGIRVVTAAPMVLEVTVGMGAAVETVASVATPGAGSGTRRSVFVPVPSGKEAEAARIMEMLLGRPASVSARAQTPQLAAASPKPSRLASKARRPGPWWTASAALFVLGLTVIIMSTPAGAPASPSVLTTLVILAGFAMWIGAVGAAGVAVVATIRSFRQARSAS